MRNNLLDLKVLSSYYDREGIDGLYYDPPEPEPGTLEPPPDGTASDPEATGYVYNPYLLFKYFRDQLCSSENGTRADMLWQLSWVGNVTDMMTNIASSMTSAMMNNADDPLVGIGYSEEVYIRVRWPWLILPAALVLSTMALLILVMVKSSSSRVVLWKSSLLALMFHGPGLTDEDHISLHKVTQMETRAKQIQVEMLGPSEEWKFVRR